MFVTTSKENHKKIVAILFKIAQHRGETQEASINHSFFSSMNTPMQANFRFPISQHNKFLMIRSAPQLDPPSGK